ncbi:hypothetical protein HFN51_03635 [Rhizobium leguminosarum]|nr:hypothetical protein [Rhizobium leguminosarum]
MSIELGSWVLPFGVTIVAFGFALASVKAGVPFYDRMVNMIFNMLILSLAAIASLSTWIAWVLVIQ